jgi:hypothetical protein
MNKKQSLSSYLSHCLRIGIAAMTLITLTGCYVEVSHEQEAYGDTDVHYSSDIADFNTQILVDAALIPFALTMEAPSMLIDPDSYTTPKARSASRALITETTYAYLFDDSDCDYGGYTQTETEAETTSYDDGYTFVELDMRAQAYDCSVRNKGVIHTINSDIDYDVSGWYDDWEKKISSIDGELEGDVQVYFNGQAISHTNINARISALSSSDYSLKANSRVLIDDGYDIEQAQLSTKHNVHFYIGASHPHQGKIRIADSYDWVELSFENDGLWRQDSAGRNTYWSWSELGFN